MPRVINMRTEAVGDAVYVGRPSRWGNPFSHKPSKLLGVVRVDSRAEAVRRYELWLRSRTDLVAAAKRELRGRDLACVCAPLPCHADVLLRVANED